jgi:hypothetical protein
MGPTYLPLSILELQLLQLRQWKCQSSVAPQPQFVQQLQTVGTLEPRLLWHRQGQ